MLTNTYTDNKKPNFDNSLQRVFPCEPEARGAAVEFEQSWKSHRLYNLPFLAQAHEPRAGCPPLDAAPSPMSYSVQAILALHPEVIEVSMTPGGRFILSTNVLDAHQLSADDVFREYKDQQSNECNVGFPF